MAKYGITIQAVEGAKPNGKLQRIRVPENPGLYLQVAAKANKNGVPTKTWLYRYKPTQAEHVAHQGLVSLEEMSGISTVWLTLGQYPHMPISKAVAEAAMLRDGRRHGLDPRKLLKPDPPPPIASSTDQPEQKTVNQLLDLFEETMMELRESTRKEYLRAIRIRVREWIDPEGQVFGLRPAIGVKGEDAAALLAACRKTASRTSAILAIKMHQCWEYGMTLEILPDQRNIWKGQIRPKLKKKDRYLTEAELALVGERFRACNEKEECVIAYKLFLLAGMRHRNLAHARWDWVDIEHKRMSIPPSHHKTGHRTGKPLVIYLSKQAIALLRRLKALQDADEEVKGTPWLYPNRDDKEDHRDDLGDPWERIRREQSWADVNIHDLRRTLASTLSALGYKGYAGEILGHTGTTVTDIYTHTTSDTLIRMLNEAGERITGLLDGTLRPGGKKALLAREKNPERAPLPKEVGGEAAEKPTGVKAIRMIEAQEKLSKSKPIKPPDARLVIKAR
jgi:integrase